MRKDFLPDREDEMVAWSANFAEKIAAAPGVYGLTDAQAAAYSALHLAFAEAYGRAQVADTRTPTGIVTKNTLRKSLEKEARALARIVKAQPGVSAERRRGLGLSLHMGGPGPRLPRPTEAPVVRVLGVASRAVWWRVQEAGSDRKGRPRGVRSVVLFTHVGEAPPAALEDWRFVGQTGSLRVVVEYGAGVRPGTKVWLTAQWANPRGERGPAGQAMSTRIDFGVGADNSGGTKREHRGVAWFRLGGGRDERPRVPTAEAERGDGLRRAA